MYPSKHNRMTDDEIMVIPILFHLEDFHRFKHYYRPYDCKH